MQLQPWLRTETDVLIVGTGRSGTTALMEAACAGLSAQPIFEPLRPESNRRVRRIVPDHGYPRLVAGEGSLAMHALWVRIYGGRHLTRWATAHAEADKLKGSRLVVKEVRATRMSGWLEAQFPEVPVRYVFRHPGDVVASMLTAPSGWRFAGYDHLVEPAAAALGVPANELAKPTDSLALWLAAVWVADTYCATKDLSAVALAHSVVYEELRASPMQTLEHFGLGLAGFDLDAAHRAITRPSKTASPAFRAQNGADTRDAVLDRGALASIDAMCRAFGVDFYRMDDAQPVADPRQRAGSVTDPSE